MKRADKAISETVGTLILLGISVSLFSVLYVSVMVINPTSASPSVNLICSLDGNNITIEHRGGKTLDLDTRLIVTKNEQNWNEPVSGYLSDEAKNNTVWNVGEHVVYPVPGGITNEKLSLSVVDGESNSVILLINLQE